MGKMDKEDKNSHDSSYNVFMSFVDVETNEAQDILSSECFLKWVETRKSPLKQPEESFRRVLTAHVCGLIGRKPFPPEVEASLLRCLRRKQTWKCFIGSEVTIGIKGFRKRGFHESRRGIFGDHAASSCLSPKATHIRKVSLPISVSEDIPQIAGMSSESEHSHTDYEPLAPVSNKRKSNEMEMPATNKSSIDCLDPLDIFNNNDSLSLAPPNKKAALESYMPSLDLNNFAGLNNLAVGGLDLMNFNFYNNMSRMHTMSPMPFGSMGQNAFGMSMNGSNFNSGRSESAVSNSSQTSLSGSRASANSNGKVSPQIERTPSLSSQPYGGYLSSQPSNLSEKLGYFNGLNNVNGFSGLGSVSGAQGNFNDFAGYQTIPQEYLYGLQSNNGNPSNLF